MYFNTTNMNHKIHKISINMSNCVSLSSGKTSDISPFAVDYLEYEKTHRDGTKTQRTLQKP